MSAAKAALKRPLAAAFDGALCGHDHRIVALRLRAFEVKEEGGGVECACACVSPVGRAKLGLIIRLR